MLISETISGIYNILLRPEPSVTISETISGINYLIKTMEAASTQKFIDIAGIQEGIIILKNGGYRMIFSVSAINFSLKSEEEQNSLIFQYQSFLNSLHFPIQIVMRSKRLDLNPYIKKVVAAKDKQKSELIKVQTEDYVDFISQLINLANIMKKTFYVVVSYDPVSVQGPSILGRLFKKSEESSDLKISAPTFKRYKEELMQRASSVATGLGSMGIHSVQLTTEEIIELFYNIYNPGIADKERFSNADELTSSFVADKREQVKDATGKTPENIEAKKEEIIDNSGIVEEQHKQQLQTRQMTADNDAERQIAAKEPAVAQKTVELAPNNQAPAPSASPTTPPAAPAITTAPPATPNPSPTGNIGNDLRPSAPINQNQAPVPPATPTVQNQPPTAPAN